MSNRKEGTGFEKELCLILSNYGWWAHNMAQNSQGQPFDVIAAHGGKTYPIDCKVCEKDIFKLNRVEENQYSAMSLWRDTGNGEGWFALRLSDRSVYMLSFSFMQTKMITAHVLGEREIRQFGMRLTEWVLKCG